MTVVKLYANVMWLPCGWNFCVVRITYTLVLMFLKCVFKCNIEYLICVLVALFKSASLHGIDTMLLLLICEAVWHTLCTDLTLSQVSAKNIMNHNGKRLSLRLSPSWYTPLQSKQGVYLLHTKLHPVLFVFNNWILSDFNSI